MLPFVCLRVHRARSEMSAGRIMSAGLSCACDVSVSLLSGCGCGVRDAVSVPRRSPCRALLVRSRITFGYVRARGRALAPRPSARAAAGRLLNRLFRGGRAVRRGNEIDRAPNTGHGAGRARLEGGAVGASASAVSDYTDTRTVVA